jgi:hypothetical protein
LNVKNSPDSGDETGGKSDGVREKIIVAYRFRTSLSYSGAEIPLTPIGKVYSELLF